MYTSSSNAKGVQTKWIEDEFWFKLDKVGHCEGLAEVACSYILKNSEYPLFVLYSPGIFISPQGKKGLGCCSKSFTEENEKYVSVQKLFKTHGVKDEDVTHNSISVEERIKRTVGYVQEITKLNNFGLHLSNILYFDGYTLNDDRHFSNFGVIYNKVTKEYRLAPIFDNGFSFLAGYTILPGISNEMIIKNIKAKPFTEDFQEQIDIANKLYGRSLIINYSVDGLESLLNSTLYSRDRVQRMISLIKERHSNYLKT